MPTYATIKRQIPSHVSGKKEETESLEKREEVGRKEWRGDFCIPLEWWNMRHLFGKISELGLIARAGNKVEMTSKYLQIFNFANPLLSLKQKKYFKICFDLHE